MAEEGAQPLVSVVIPAYNAARFINVAVDSVLAQTWQHREVLVVDDGSTDNTTVVLRDYGDTIRVISKPNGGLSSARNRGIQEARGEYVAFLDADDHWLPEKLACQVGVMEGNPQVGFCSTAAQVVTPNGAHINTWPCPVIQDSLLETLFLQNGAIPGSGSGVIVRRNLFDKVGTFDEDLRSLEDIDQWMRLAAVTDYQCIEARLTVIIKHPDSMSRNFDVMFESARRVMKKNRGLLHPTQQGQLWRNGFANMLLDYAKWEYRQGHILSAMRRLFQALLMAPLSRGRSAIGLGLAIALRKPL